MPLRMGIKRNPECEPQETDGAGQDKGPLPTIMQSDPRYGEWSDDRADIRAGVKDARGQRAFLFRKPFGYGFDRSRKISGFTQTQSGSRDSESESRASQGVTHGGKAPDRQGHGVADLRSEPINEASREQQTQGVRRIEGGHNIAIVDFAPPERCLETFGKNSNHLAIDE